MFGRIINYFKEVRAEMRYVEWPSRKQVINFTVAVIGISFVMAVFLGVFDVLFGYILNKYILKF